MQNTFKKAADVYKTAKRVFDKLKDSNIVPYNGEDAYYSGSDSEYEEFLNNMDTENEMQPEEAVQSEEAEHYAAESGDVPSFAEDTESEVESEDASDDTQSESEAEDDTKRAPSWQAMMRSLAKRYKSEEEPEDIKELEKSIERLSEEVDAVRSMSEVSDENAKRLSESIDAVNDKITRLCELSEGGEVTRAAAQMSDMSAEVRSRVDAMTGVCADISSRINQISEVVLDIKAQNSQNRARVEAISDAAGRIERVCEDIAGTTSAMSKLNDNVFELKKAQLETRRDLADEMDIIDSVKRRFTIGITILCLLTAISIFLQIFNFLY